MHLRSFKNRMANLQIGRERTLIFLQNFNPKSFVIITILTFWSRATSVRRWPWRFIIVEWGRSRAWLWSNTFNNKGRWVGGDCYRFTTSIVSFISWAVFIVVRRIVLRSWAWLMSCFVWPFIRETRMSIRRLSMWWKGSSILKNFSINQPIKERTKRSELTYPSKYNKPISCLWSPFSLNQKSHGLATYIEWIVLDDILTIDYEFLTIFHRSADVFYLNDILVSSDKNKTRRFLKTFSE